MTIRPCRTDALMVAAWLMLFASGPPASTAFADPTDAGVAPNFRVGAEAETFSPHYGFAGTNWPLVWELGEYGDPSGNGNVISVVSSRSSSYVEADWFLGEIWVNMRCTRTLTLDPVRRILTGVEICRKRRTKIVLWHRERLEGITTISDVYIALPAWNDGHWEIQMNLSREGTRLSGSAMVEMVNSSYLMALTGEWSPTTEIARIHLREVRSEKGGSALDLSTVGPHWTLTSMSGRLNRQRVSYQARHPLSLSIEGCGQVRPFSNGTVLVAGRNYVATAQPCADSLFSHWTIDGAITNVARLPFMMRSNLTLTAHFIPNRFIGLQGTYSGLFHETNGVSPTSSGFFNFRMTDHGAFSGKLQQGSASQAFSGQFGPGLDAEVTVLRAGSPPTNLRLELAEGSDRVIGQVGNGVWQSTLAGCRAGFNAQSHPAVERLGTYTLLLSGETDRDLGPMGHGCAVVTVSSAGDVRLTGNLADGSPIVQTAPMGAAGQWPFYVGLYSGRGSVLGWMTISTNSNLSANEITGTNVWMRPSTPPDDRPILTREVAGIGSRYVPPPTGQPVLDLTNAVMVLEGGNLPSALTYHVQLTDHTQLTFTPPNLEKVTLQIATPTGVIRGSFLHPTGHQVAVRGVVLQNRNIGGGYFLGPEQQSGMMNLGRLAD